MAEEADAINNKKNGKNSDTGKPDYSGFFSGIISRVITIFLVVGIVGSIGLYTCKVAQANVLPDSMDFIPFGKKEKSVEEIPININIVKQYGMYGLGWLLGEAPKVSSTKIDFDINQVNKSYAEGLIGVLNALKNDPEKSSYFGLYLRDVILNTIANNNLFINKLFGALNQYLPESVILILTPFIYSFLFIVVYLVNVGLCFFYQIKYWEDFFMDKGTKNNNVSWYKPFTYLRPVRGFAFFLYCLFLFFPFMFILPFIVMIYTYLSPILISGKTERTNQDFGFFDFVKNVFLYKNQFFLFLMTLVLVSQTATSLGTNALIGCIVGILLVVFVFHLFGSTNVDDDPNLTPGLVSVKPAKMKGGTMTGGTMTGGKLKTKKKA